MSRRLRAFALLLSIPVLGALAATAPAAAVIGGSVSTHGPWAVRMLVDGKPECTGTAISKEWIISASHCFFEHAEPIADSRIEFRVGSLDQRTGKPVHPVQNSRRGSDVADMMLIKVPPMPVTPAKLPSSGPVKPGQQVRQLGWGATCTGDENSCQSDVLRQSELRVLPATDKRCKGFAIPNGPDFCSVSVSGVPAGGDSGGPVMSTSPGQADTLIGVFNSSDRASMAGTGDVSRQLNWIRDTIRN
ncbi:S1 family peptidase [Sciscionella sediminilitoris]|uniref:S1 family peptidase n=1 Tax=Sciscionella sediminilitoris TaxID=1445613 RepID=UPI0004DF076D|nr:trypsin-like serine protease [Sciscionella sp. SE31]